MLKRAQIGGSVNIDAENGVGPKQNSKNDADLDLNGHGLQVTIPSGPARDNVEIETPTSTVSSGFGTLLHSINDAMPQMTVRLPNSPRDEVSGFDVTGSSDNGTVIVQKLDNVQHKTPAEIETLLRSGHRILAVHIPLAACRFEETVEVLNAVLPFKPEFYVKREPDWLSNLQSLGDYTGHVGIKWMEDGETPKQSSSGQVSYTSTPNPEPAEDDLTNDGMVTPLFDEHLDTHLPQPDDDRDPVAHDYLSATTIAPEPEPAYNSESDEEVEADFVEPAFEHDYFSSVCNAPVFDDEKLCRLAELPATIVEEEEPFDEETEELVRLKKQTFVQSIRGSDRLAKISMRSKDSIRVPQKVLRSPAVLIQKRTELPPKVEAEAEVEVFVSRPVTPIVEVQPPIAASSLQLHASLKVAEAETPRGRAPHKRRFFKKPSMKRGLSAPELPFDVNDQNELYSNLPLDFQSDKQSAQSSVDGRTQASEPVSVSRHRSHSRVRRSASYFADPGEKEVVFPLKYRKHRDSTFVQEPSDTPSRLNIHVLPVDKAIEQKMMENVYESFTPRFSTKTELASTEYGGSIVRRASLIDRLASKLRRSSSSRENVQLLSVKKVQEPAVVVKVDGSATIPKIKPTLKPTPKVEKPVVLYEKPLALKVEEPIAKIQHAVTVDEPVTVKKNEAIHSEKNLTIQPDLPAFVDPNNSVAFATSSTTDATEQRKVVNASKYADDLHLHEPESPIFVADAGNVSSSDDKNNNLPVNDSEYVEAEVTRKRTVGLHAHKTEKDKAKHGRPKTHEEPSADYTPQVHNQDLEADAYLSEVVKNKTSRLSGYGNLALSPKPLEFDVTDELPSSKHRKAHEQPLNGSAVKTPKPKKKQNVAPHQHSENASINVKLNVHIHNSAKPDYEIDDYPACDHYLEEAAKLPIGLKATTEPPYAKPNLVAPQYYNQIADLSTGNPNVEPAYQLPVMLTSNKHEILKTPQTTQPTKSDASYINTDLNTSYVNNYQLTPAELAGNDQLNLSETNEYPTYNNHLDFTATHRSDPNYYATSRKNPENPTLTTVEDPVNKKQNGKTENLHNKAQPNKNNENNSDVERNLTVNTQKDNTNLMQTNNTLNRKKTQTKLTSKTNVEATLPAKQQHLDLQAALPTEKPHVGVTLPTQEPHLDLKAALPTEKPHVGVFLPAGSGMPSVSCLGQDSELVGHERPGQPEFSLLSPCFAPQLPNAGPPDVSELRLDNEAFLEGSLKGCVDITGELPNSTPHLLPADTENRPDKHRHSVASTASLDDEVVPDFEPKHTRQNTMLRKPNRNPSKFERADVATQCDMDSSDDELDDADRVSLTGSLVMDLLDSDLE